MVSIEFTMKLGHSELYRTIVGFTADHGRSDWLGYWIEFVQKARFKKLACLCHIKQNNLTYLGRVRTPCLSLSTGIYGFTEHFTDVGKLNFSMLVRF